ncbi:hypothetical protein PTSG_00373 [Salpingoeca rosetta]|uniref:Pinin/SDK/MemA protein domain-containing protein n=1 Tax=Salpingoeca rosetta (strain ATCC 50818 / BSB-021) TaxID=946362 RepID=F2TWA7_SALR5|nr:uncharacterized protein PTSG_00373 [Salpingoeca rosetta]EGD72353.1 hypothetical protein PTSG_00373 [Salpingoeca rosetta]|eukprot:XP_004998922.1 hypothetical protein PTSG_00373 [Salpingoeca rosetta]
MDDAIERKRRELEDIESKITQVTGANPNESPKRGPSDRHMREDDDADDEQFMSGRLRSTIATKRSRNGSSSVIPERSPSKPEAPRRPSLSGGDGKSAARNRRMFGMLMGTLEQANKRTEKSTTQKKFDEIDQRLREQTEKEREESKQERIQLYTERRAKQAELLTLEQNAVLPRLTDEWQAHYDSLKVAIKTKASPPIFFLPGKHTEKTRELLEETSKDIDQLVSFRKDDYWKVLLPARLRGDGTEDHDDDEDIGEENGHGGDDGDAHTATGHGMDEGGDQGAGTGEEKAAQQDSKDTAQ